MKIKRYQNQIYAGVLGKLIGVYLGRPIEGWTYEAIRDSFYDVNYFVHNKVKVPLIVPDDDISGTFVFFRSLEDNNFSVDLTAAQIGDTWLNYIIENRTVLWWGGLSRSTEHTAYLRLKDGINAPQSGSSELNGKSISEQIGSQIFIDGWALACPNQPELAMKLAKEAASVSHDGIAIDAACFIANMEANAFEEKNIFRLIDQGLEQVNNPFLTEIVNDLTEQCQKTNDWRNVREWISKYHGYDKYPGSCPMVTNHLVVLMALIMGEDDFQKSIMIACSAGWDTDCNAGNVGCLNGIRLGLEGIDQGPDFRKAISDRMYVVSADGGSCITDAVIETRKIVKAAAALLGEEDFTESKRFVFEYPGSVQGFMRYTDTLEEQANTRLYNLNEIEDSNGLVIEYEHLSKGNFATVSVDTFIELESKGKEGTSYFEVLASPSLYSTQTIKLEVDSLEVQSPNLKLFIDVYGKGDKLIKYYSPKFNLTKGINFLEWELPNTGGHSIYRFGIELTSEKRLDGRVVIKSIDWKNEPRKFEMKKAIDLTPSMTPWTTDTTWIKSFMSSIENFNPDFAETFSISHSTANGVATIGGTDWEDYSVSSQLIFTNQESAGLVARSKGHRRYYSVLFTNSKLKICKRRDAELIELATVDFNLELDKRYDVIFYLKGETLEVSINGDVMVTAKDDEYRSGGAGFVVNSGAILANGFKVEAIGSIS
ncbi:ADP-ribosylglycohydrolase family protein [Sporosarcina sp. Marseille-Q4063]|uniref:ADP-ribosylglycohydrolase family protein n=1 Tax=Sporosarcina sp. Marseille-Q4063 TaxID=2810514 RepID=UPI001BB060CC|nr:ADP-ribosylglycohydrolase family protein [Sporosarcina sp. Marseille-Q4063]QUW23041.1 ADP-ribosylglycohydrolase family protein [Sporosarcina sp. Marseille-Q4063]